MNTTERRLIMTEAIHRYGKRHQMELVIEEMSELTKEICKNFRGENNSLQITEEIADVQIMLEQLCMLLNIQKSDIDGWIEYKMKRLRTNMRGEEDVTR